MHSCESREMYSVGDLDVVWLARGSFCEQNVHCTAAKNQIAFRGCLWMHPVTAGRLDK